MEDIDLNTAAPDALPWTAVADADPFCIITTSGSTGTPKGVVLPHRGYIDNLTKNAGRHGPAPQCEAGEHLAN